MAYDIGGNRVKIAFRIENMSKSGKIITSQSTYDFVKSEFVCEYRGEIYAKNRGNLNMYFGNG
ncbi:adenylate/guanylate cyclase domain-containing protein, partial [Maribacter arcticus]|uniref:adenylate/guanylate cyclase domain-containing protein n=1 Tax=Maribacter arcticus TaxID=561365 RepID=UPI003C6D96B7